MIFPRFFKWVNRCIVGYHKTIFPWPMPPWFFCSNHHISWWTFFVPISMRTSADRVNQAPQQARRRMQRPNFFDSWASPMSTLWLCQNSYWKWPFIVDFPIDSMVDLSIAMLVYQRVVSMNFYDVCVWKQRTYTPKICMFFFSGEHMGKLDDQW